MSQILTKCIVISYSHCKFKKRLHPSFKKNFHAPLQTIRFLSSAFKKSSPIQEEIASPIADDKILIVCIQEKFSSPIQEEIASPIADDKILIVCIQEKSSPTQEEIASPIADDKILIVCVQESSHPPFKKTLHPPLQIQEEITSPIQEDHLAALQGERRLRHWPGTDSCISICMRMVKYNMMHMRMVYNMYMRWWLHIYICT